MEAGLRGKRDGEGDGTQGTVGNRGLKMEVTIELKDFGGVK